MPSEALAPLPSAPASSPAPLPASGGERPISDYMGDIGSELGDIDSGKAPAPPLKQESRRSKPEPMVPKKPTAPKPEEKTTEKPVEKATEKPAEVTPPEPAKPVKTADLRVAYEGMKKKLKDLEPELKAAKEKLQEYETKGPAETGPILEKMKTIEARNAELENKIELIAYEESTDYISKYDQPYRQKWNEAVAAFGQLRVRQNSSETDPETGDPKVSYRPATADDLIQLGSLSLSELDEQAAAMIGASAPRAIDYIEKLRELSEAKRNAVIDRQKNAAEQKSQRSLADQARNKSVGEAWSNVNAGLEEKYPAAFQPSEGDPEDAAAHSKGFALADLLFLGANKLTKEQIDLLPSHFKAVVESKKPLSDIDKVRLHALARLKMANHDRLVAAQKKHLARITELEKSLKEFEDSEPKFGRPGSGPRNADKPWDLQVAEELAAMDR